MKIVVAVLSIAIGSIFGYYAHVVFPIHLGVGIGCGISAALLVSFVIVPICKVVGEQLEESRNRKELEDFELDCDANGGLRQVDVPNQLLIDDDEKAYLYQRITCYSSEEVPGWGNGSLRDLPSSLFPAMLSEGGGYGWRTYKQVLFIATDRRFIMVYSKGHVHDVRYSELRRFDNDKGGLIAFGKKGSGTLSFAFVFKNPYIAERILRMLSKK